MPVKNKIIFDVRDFLDSGEYFKCVYQGDINTNDKLVKIISSTISLFRNLPCRKTLNYDNDLIKIRQNLRLIEENPEYVINKKLREEKFGGDWLNYKKIYTCRQNLTQEQATECIEWCFSKFKFDVENYKKKLRAEKYIEILGKPPLETIEENILEEEKEDTDQQNKWQKFVRKNSGSPTSSEKSSNDSQENNLI